MRTPTNESCLEGRRLQASGSVEADTPAFSFTALPTLRSAAVLAGRAIPHARSNTCAIRPHQRPLAIGDCDLEPCLIIQAFP